MKNRLIILEGLPTILQFFGKDSIRLLGRQIIPQWTETGTVYTKQVLT